MPARTLNRKNEKNKTLRPTRTRKTNSTATNHLPRQLTHRALLGRKARRFFGAGKHRQEQAHTVVVFVVVVADDDWVVGVA
jgi:hypothetical protein